MHKRTDTTINLFIDKLDKSGVGISFMQNENVCFVPYTLPGERVKVNIINKFKSKMYCSNLEILENSSEDLIKLVNILLNVVVVYYNIGNMKIISNGNST